MTIVDAIFQPAGPLTFFSAPLVTYLVIVIEVQRLCRSLRTFILLVDCAGLESGKQTESLCLTC